MRHLKNTNNTEERMTFSLKNGMVVRTLPCGDTVEIIPTEDGFNIEVYYLNEDQRKRTVFYKRYKSKELTGVPGHNEKT